MIDKLDAVKGVSLITVVKDEPVKYVLELIFSLLHQSYPNWECIFIDTNKNIAASGVIKRFAKQDSRIKIVNARWHCRSGVEALIEKNVEQVKLSHVSIIEPNCKLAENAMREIVTMLLDVDDMDIVYTDECIVDDEGFFYPTCIKKDVPIEFIVEHWLKMHLTVIKKEIAINIVSNTEVCDVGALRKGYIAKNLYYRCDIDSDLRKRRCRKKTT